MPRKTKQQLEAERQAEEAQAAAAAKYAKLQAAVLDQARLLEEGRRCYQQAGTLLEQIVAETKPGQLIALPDGRTARLIDQFETRSRVAKTVYTDRYRVEIAEAS